MSTSYQVRIAQRGVNTVEGNVDVVLPLAVEGEDSLLANLPVVGGQTVYPAEGRTESNPWTVQALDKDGVLSGLLEEQGRAAALGRLVEFRRRDEGEDWESLDTGRLSHVGESQGPGLVEIQVTDERWVERRADIFATTSDIQVFPRGVTVAFMDLLEPAGTRTVRVMEVEGEFFRLATGVALPEEVLDRLVADVRPEANGAGGVPGGNFHTLRFQATGLATFVVHNVGGSRIQDPLSAARALEGRLNSIWLHLPGHEFDTHTNNEVTGRLFFQGTETSEAFPRLVGGADGIHLGELWKRVADGVYGGGPMRYDSAAVAALVAADLPRVWLRMQSKVNRARFLEDSVNALAGIVPLRDGEGRLVPRLFWMPGAEVDPDELPELDPSNTEGHTWEQVGREAITVIRFTSKRVRLDTEDEPAALDGLVSFDYNPPAVEHTGPGGSPAWEELGEREHRVETDCILGFADERRTFRFLAHELFDVFGDGPFRRRLTCPETLGHAPGDMVRVKVGDWKAPNWSTGDRTGSIIARVLERRIHPAHFELVLLDGGPALQPLAAPNVSIVQDESSPDLMRVTVSDLPEGARATVELAWKETDTQPAADEWEDREPNQAEGEVTFRLPISGGFAHAAAYSTAPNRLRSARAFDSVALSVRPIIEDLRVEMTNGTPTTHLKANDDTEGVRLRWAIHAEGETEEFGDPSDHPVAAFPLEMEGVTVPAGRTITVEATPYPGFNP